MQVAAPPITSQQSPSAAEEIDLSKLSQAERHQFQLSQWKHHSLEVAKLRDQGDALQQKKESEERQHLHKMWLDTQQRKAKEDEKAREGAAAMQAAAHGGAAFGGMGGAAPAKMDSRKRKMEDEGYRDEYRQAFNDMSRGPMMSHQNWQYMQQQQQYQMGYHPQPPHLQMMMGQQPQPPQQAPQQFQLQPQPQRIPPMMPQQPPTTDGGYPAYPACSTGPSTSTANGASSSTSSDGFPPSDPAPFVTNHPSPAVVPSCSATSSATPPQGQVPSEQIPTPPALNGGGNPPDDLANLANVNTESMQQLVGSLDGPTMVDLGADVFGDDFSQPSTSTGHPAQPLQAGTPSSVLSPDGFQMPVNGPHSVQSTHSHHNPMSNGNMNPPATPTNILSQPAQQPQPQQQIPQYPQQIGAPLFTSTPKTTNQQQMPPAMNPMATMHAHSPMGAMGAQPPQMPSPLAQPMQPLPSPSMQPTNPMNGMAPQMGVPMPQTIPQYPPITTAPMHPMAAGYPGYPPEMMGAMPPRPMMPTQQQQQMAAAVQHQQQQQYYAAMMQQQQQQRQAAMMNPMQMQQMQQMQMLQHREMIQRRMMMQQQQQQQQHAAQMRYPGSMMEQQQMMAAAAAGRMPPSGAPPMPSPSFAPYSQMIPQYPMPQFHSMH